MKIRCPNDCFEGIPLSSGVCPKCGWTISFASVARHYFNKISALLAHDADLPCQNCDGKFKAKQSTCPKCKRPISLKDLLIATSTGPREKWNNLITTATPQTKLKIQRGYFAFSLLVLWVLLGFNADRPGSSILISSLYMGVFVLLSYWLFPRKTMRTVGRSTSSLMKLSLVINFLCAVLLLHLFISIWSARATSLAILFVITWLGFWLFGTLLLPAIKEGHNVFFPEDNPHFDPSASQGRKAKKD